MCFDSFLSQGEVSGIARLLLKRGADPTTMNDAGLTPLHLAVRTNLPNDQGCDGGDMSSAFNWTIMNGGLVAEVAYH